MSPGWVYCHAYCFNCGRFFSFNPHRVPSIRAAHDHPREPICSACFDEINSYRASKGMPPFERYPDAYDPLPEAEL
jgi:hypothetical protein